MSETKTGDPRDKFLNACVWHGSLDEAAAILAAHPEIASSDVYTAAILGDDTAVRRFLELDPGNATVKGGPRGWDALTYLCFSKYLRLDRARSDGFVRAATALLDAGASANTGFYEAGHGSTRRTADTSASNGPRRTGSCWRGSKRFPGFVLRPSPAAFRSKAAGQVAAS
jgi:hypothetical protein